MPRQKIKARIYSHTKKDRKMASPAYIAAKVALETYINGTMGDIDYILALLPVDTLCPQFLLEIADPADKWTALSLWLAKNNIGTATMEQYQDPQSLVAGLSYCVVGNGIDGAFLLFNVVAVSDWEGDPPTPQYATVTGSLSWMMEPEPSPAKSKEMLEIIAKLNDLTSKI
jgi:hypothetical protein